MFDLSENIYNARTSRDQPKFKLWQSAGLIITYRCSAACRFCYYCCSGAPSPVMSVETALSSWQALKSIAGQAAKVHISGGEPFLEWDRLAEIVQAAKKEGLGPIEQVETNASWATSYNLIKDRLSLLSDCGMETLKISCDPFHQEFVNIDTVKTLASVAQELLGPDRVVVRWRKYLENPVLTANMPAEDRNKAHKDSLSEFPCRLTGRAARDLADSLANKTIDELNCRNCAGSFLAAKGVHIDPLGNVFSGTCSGIIIGNVLKEPLDIIWKQIDWHDKEFVDILIAGGPVGLLENALKCGYQKRRFYSSRCHLCTSIRAYYHNIGLYKSIIGPAYCYAD